MIFDIIFQQCDNDVKAMLRPARGHYTMIGLIYTHIC